jgi:hypothetical protein
MGFWDFVEAATPWSTVEAEAPAKEEEVCTYFSFDWGDWMGWGWRDVGGGIEKG